MGSMPDMNDVPDMSETAESAMVESGEAKLLFECKLEIEQAWMSGRDRGAVHRLAGAHPEVADELYEFFAFMVETHVGVSHQREVRRGSELTAVKTAKAAKPFLGLLRDATGESVQAIAAAMEVTADFLVDLSDNGRVLPAKAREELVRRARGMREIGEGEALGSFDVVSLRRAASRDTAYPVSNLTFKELVERSSLSPEQKRFWTGLG